MNKKKHKVLIKAWREAFSLSLLSMMLVVGFSWMPFISLRKFLSIPVLLSFHMNGCWDFWQMFFLHLFQSSPNRDDFAPWGYLPMCGDIFVGHNLRARCYWHLVGIARGCGKRPAVHKTALHNKDCLGQRSVLLRKPRSIHIIMWFLSFINIEY